MSLQTALKEAEFGNLLECERICSLLEAADLDRTHLLRLSDAVDEWDKNEVRLKILRHLQSLLEDNDISLAGELARRSGDPVNAQALFEKALESDPADTLALVGLGRIAWERPGRDEMALEYCNRAIATDFAAEAFFFRGECAEARGDFVQAIEDYGLAISRDPTRARFRVARAEVFEFLQRYQAAIDDYSVAVSLCYNPVKLLLKRAECFRLVEDDEAAINDLETLLVHEPFHSEAINNLFHIWEMADAYDHTVTKATELLAERQSPDAIKKLALFSRATANLDAGRLGEALRDAKAAVEEYPGPRALLNLGQVHKESGRFDEALVNYETVLSHELDNTDGGYRNDALYGKASVFFKLHRYDDALKILTDLIECGVDDGAYQISALILSGICYYESGDRSSALSALDSALQQSAPYDPRALFWRAFLRYQSGDVSGSLGDLDALRAEWPEIAEQADLESVNVQDHF